MLVPKNKTIYIGARRFVEGDLLPPFVQFEIPIMTKKQAEIKAKRKPRKKYKSKSEGLF